jgi:uncharacterized protein (DUF433 family)
MSIPTLIPASPIKSYTDLSQYIEIRLMENRPHIKNRRLPVSFVAKDFANGDTLREIGDNYSITQEQVMAALLYYYEHRDEIDTQDAEEERLWQEMASQSANYNRKPIINLTETD